MPEPQSLSSSSPKHEQIVVFLDIDGVLRPFNFSDEGPGLFPTECLEALAHILGEFPKADLVLSSTWRVQQSFIDMITEAFQAFGGSLREVKFFDITNPALHSERQLEIYDWLDSHQRQPSAWIALDDEELLEGAANAKHRSEFLNHVVQTDSHQGMTMAHAQRAVQLIRSQLDNL